MATSKPQPNRELIETGTEPEFFCTDIRFEVAGGGNMRVFAYNLRHRNELHLLFTAVIPIEALAVMARQALGAASDAHNLEMWQSDSDSH